MAETEVVRCAACSLRIATQDGHYHLVDGHFHPECYDRNQLEALASEVAPVWWTVNRGSVSI